MNRINVYITMMFLLAAMPAAAPAAGFTVEVDRTVIARGERVTVVATLVSPRRVRDVPHPGPNEYFDVLSVDTRYSQTRNIQIINGKHEFKTEYVYNYIYTIAPKVDGEFTFPSMTVTIDGTPVRSPPLRFNVSGEEPERNPDINVSLSISKEALFLGEQAVLTLKIATKANAPVQLTQRGYAGAIDQIEKMFGREFSLSRLFTSHVEQGQERAGGELYNTFTLRFSAFGLTPGEYSIPPVTFEYEEIRRMQSQRRRSHFPGGFIDMDDFFGGGRQAVQRTARSAPFTVTVMPAPPGAPHGFGGSVGNFSLSATAEPANVPAGEAVTVEITLSGNTRASNIGDPIMPELKNCDVFTPERQTASDTSANGLFTRKTYRYLVIPRVEGALAIGPITYPYLNPQTGAYEIARAHPISVTVTPGKGGSREQARYSAQEDIRQIGHDIRYIKTPSAIRHREERPYRAPYWYLLFPMPFLLFFAVLAYKILASRSGADQFKNIRQKALANAVRELNKASKTCNGDSEFLGKASTVIEKYISNKFAIPATGRTLEELKDELLARKIDEQTVFGLTMLIESINEHRFGGKAFDTRSRGDLINRTVNFLSSMERVVKREKTSSAILLTAAAAAMLTLSLPARAFASNENVNGWFKTANGFYAADSIAGNYDSALTYYTKILDAGVRNGAVYFNMGNCYHRLNKPGMARLHYEKAAVLSPNDADIQANINFIKSIIVDRAADADESDFIATVTYNIHTLLSLEVQLAILCALLFALALISSAILLKKGLARLWLAYGAVLCAILIAVIGTSAGYKIYALETHQYAVVITPSLDAQNQPAGTQTLFTAHEGTKLRISKTVGDWSLVSLPNGASGWVTTASLGRI